MPRAHRVGSRVDAIDLFAGFGGSSQGIDAAGADLRLAANHNPLAIECHAANFPDADHVRADLSNPEMADYVDPASLPPSRYMWASPSCRHHSVANSRKIYAQGPAVAPGFDHEAYAASERSRVTMLCPLRYAAAHLPELVAIENVVEVTRWGPDKDGSTFRWWLREWAKIGYDFRILSLNSRFFPPCPQSRDRVYIVLWRRGNVAPDLEYRPTARCSSDTCGGSLVESVQTWRAERPWPGPVGKYGQAYDYRCSICHAVVEPLSVPAYAAIDWRNLGQRIGERERPLATSTIERIRRGLAKYGASKPVVLPSRPVLRASSIGFEHMPFTIEMRGGGSRVSGQHPITTALQTVTAGGLHHGLVSPAIFAKFNGSPQDTAWHTLAESLGTITARDTTGIVMLPWATAWQEDPASTLRIMAEVHAELASMSTEPLSNADLDKLHFRMLEPRTELRRAMAFAEDYVLLGNKSQVTAGLGNAVVPPVASWITQRCLATLAGTADLAA